MMLPVLDEREPVDDTQDFLRQTIVQRVKDYDLRAFEEDAATRSEFAP